MNTRFFRPSPLPACSNSNIMRPESGQPGLDPGTVLDEVIFQNDLALELLRMRGKRHPGGNAMILDKSVKEKHK